MFLITPALRYIFSTTESKQTPDPQPILYPSLSNVDKPDFEIDSDDSGNDSDTIVSSIYTVDNLLYNLREVVSEQDMNKKAAKITQLYKLSPEKTLDEIRILLELLKEHFPGKGLLTQGTLEQLRMIEHGQIKYPSLKTLAEQVIKSEASQSGFAFENYLVFLMANTYAQNIESNGYHIKFPLYYFILQNIATDSVDKYFRLMTRRDVLMDYSQTVYNVHNRQDFIKYCQQRTPGIAKPSGGSQFIGPDISIWWNTEVLILIGCKTSKVLYEYSQQKSAKKKTPSELLIDHDTFMANDYTLDVQNFGISRNASERLTGSGPEFNSKVRSALFSDPYNSLKLIIRINVVLPYRVKTTKPSEEYLEASQQKPVMKDRVIAVGDRIFQYQEMRVNINSQNILSTGLLDFDPGSKEIIEELYIKPWNDIILNQ